MRVVSVSARERKGTMSERREKFADAQHPRHGLDSQLLGVNERRRESVNRKIKVDKNEINQIK